MTSHVRTLPWAALLLLLIAGPSCHTAPDARADAAFTPLAGRAEALLRGMSREEKAGQLFVSWILAREAGNRAARDELLAHVRDVGLGGVILSLGPVEDAADLVTELQAAAAVPLLCAGDFEGGVAFRFHGATEMGNQMLVGATRSEELARQMGEVTGREAKALGVPWVFAPVLDVNSNPANPIINVRSFGEDPALVARLGSALAAGVRSQGAIPCGKHFPGHGDVDSDSHLELPTVRGDGDRLRSVELLPFARASAEGLESIMTGHLAVPGLGEDPTVPATLSERILGGVLRGELGFEGLVVTDALDMGGVRNKLEPGEVAVRALLAGADVLLMPPDPRAARDAVVAAVASGRVPERRLDDAVLRILRTKERVGLLGGGNAGPVANWRELVNTPASQAIGREIAARGVTLVQDPAGALPLQPSNVDRLLIEVHDAQPDTGSAALGPALHDRGLLAPDHGADQLLAASRAIQLHPDSTAEEVAAAVRAVELSTDVILALHVRVRSYSGRIGLPTNLRPVVDALTADHGLVAVSFGNPYLIRELPAAVLARCCYLCAYASSVHTVAAVGAVLAGERAATGRLPVTIPGVAQVGAGGAAVAAPAMTPSGSRAAAVARLDHELRDLLGRAVLDQVFPGAVCLVNQGGATVCTVAVGRESYAEDAPAVSVHTRYDLASLTKVCATTPLVLSLVAAGALALEDPVQKWLPDFSGGRKAEVTVRHLLAHTAGLPPFRRYFADPALTDRAAILAAAVREPLTGVPGEAVVYSDIGMMLLMLVTERAGGMPFEDLARRRVLEPLGMAGACFAPTAEPPIQAAPTERMAATGQVQRGHVHDENAWSVGGISGHAGLFATADDVLRIGRMMLSGGGTLLPAALVDEALRPQRQVGSRRGLGFDLLPQGDAGSRSWAGRGCGVGAFGHTGFTGTSLWCDPASGVCVVLLSNRVHPSREHPERIREVRAELHDRVAAAFAGPPAVGA